MPTKGPEARPTRGEAELPRRQRRGRRGGQAAPRCRRAGPPRAKRAAAPRPAAPAAGRRRARSSSPAAAWRRRCGCAAVARSPPTVAVSVTGRVARRACAASPRWRPGWRSTDDSDAPVADSSGTAALEAKAQTRSGCPAAACAGASRKTPSGGGSSSATSLVVALPAASVAVTVAVRSPGQTHAVTRAWPAGGGARRRAPPVQGRGDRGARLGLDGNLAAPDQRHGRRRRLARVFVPGGEHGVGRLAARRRLPAARRSAPRSPRRAAPPCRACPPSTTAAGASHLARSRSPSPAASPLPS